MQGGYCLSVRPALIQGHGSKRPPLFAPVLSFFQPFRDLSNVARRAPGQSVAVKGVRFGRAEASGWDAGLSKHIYSKYSLVFKCF